MSLPYYTFTMKDVAAGLAKAAGADEG